MLSQNTVIGKNKLSHDSVQSKIKQINFVNLAIWNCILMGGERTTQTIARQIKWMQSRGSSLVQSCSPTLKIARNFCVSLSEVITKRITSHVPTKYNQSDGTFLFVLIYLLEICLKGKMWWRPRVVRYFNRTICWYSHTFWWQGFSS